MIDKGQWREFGQDTGVTPLLFTRSAMGFLMTTESQDLGLTSHQTLNRQTLCFSPLAEVLQVHDVMATMTCESSCSV